FVVISGVIPLTAAPPGSWPETTGCIPGLFGSVIPWTRHTKSLPKTRRDACPDRRRMRGEMNGKEESKGEGDTRSAVATPRL
ncbi:MAG: hypothetical protein PHH09_05505, partial [Methanoregulaceae archaeon]|nr:hypothetical protein [Methanoregulaceae archaeon]